MRQTTPQDIILAYNKYHDWVEKSNREQFEEREAEAKKYDNMVFSALSNKEWDTVWYQDEYGDNITMARSTLSSIAIKTYKMSKQGRADLEKQLREQNFVNTSEGKEV